MAISRELIHRRISMLKRRQIPPGAPSENFWYCCGQRSEVLWATVRNQTDGSFFSPILFAFGARRIMTSDLIPADVRQFILNHIDSVSELEALLLLRKCADQNWTAQGVSDRIYLDEAAVVRILARLAACGLCVASDNVYRYGAAAHQAEMVDRLAALYARFLIPVTNLIHNRPARIQQFADAFLFRKEK